MVDLLSLAIIYAILNVASSISSNLASGGIFELLKPKDSTAATYGTISFMY